MSSSFRHSIVNQLVKVIFSWYCVMVVLLTSLHVWVEYRYTEASIAAELKANQIIFHPLLAKALWDLDREQLQGTLKGMLAVPIIQGIKVEQRGELLGMIGRIAVCPDTSLDTEEYNKAVCWQAFNNQGEAIAAAYASDEHALQHRFGVSYVFRGKKNSVGQVTVYADHSAIWSRLEVGFSLLFINSIIKIVAFWILFLWVARRLLLRPLSLLVNAIEEVDFDRLNLLDVDLQTRSDNELKRIERAFTLMIAKLNRAKESMIDFNRTLELKVVERTMEITRSKDEADSANQVKSIFLMRMSHELRTPLNAIIGFSKMQQRLLRKEAAPRMQEMADSINRAGHHLLMLIEDIMDFMTLEQKGLLVELETVDVGAVINESAELVSFMAEEQGIDVYSKPIGLEVVANYGRLRQVLVNLLTNAIKYNSKGGRVSLSAEVREDKVLIRVEDTGVGVAEEDLDKLFEAFTRLAYAERSAIQGTGIGLSLAKSLVEKMQGEITVTSKLGEGSCFTLVLPVSR